MDPEQIYQEVLQEEQQKGSSPPVAEGRAKAARQRAIEGSPHPKEPKWWPGSQPHLEGGDAAPAAKAEEAEEEAEPVEEEPPEPVAAEEPVATEEPAAAEEPAPEPAVAEATPEPASEPAATTAAPAPAAAQSAAAVPDTGAMGVAPGTPAGNRLRPEDAVATDAQFAGQKAMEQRRKLIDELIETGVPAVTAAETGRSGSGVVTLMFLLIPVLAILFLVNNDSLRATSDNGATPTETPGEAEGAATDEISASGLQFSTDAIEVPAGKETDFTFVNDDTAPHNIFIYPDAAAADAAGDTLFAGEDVLATKSVTYTFPALDKGEYPFLCRIHPAMRGTVTAK